MARRPRGPSRSAATSALAKRRTVLRSNLTRRLAQERERLHPLPAEPYTAAFGVTREVGKIEPVINFESGEYSVPDDYVGQTVWVRYRITRL